MGMGLASGLPGPIQMPSSSSKSSFSGGLEDRLRLVGRLALAAGTMDGLAGDADGRAASVVADGNPFVVFEQRLVGAEEPAGVFCVDDAGVKVGVVADACREQKFAFGGGMEEFGTRGGMLREEGGDGLAEGDSVAGFLAEELIEGACVCCLTGGERVCFQQAALRESAQGEDVVADGDAGLRLVVRWTEDSEGEVLDGEVGMAVGVLNPGA